VKNLKYWSIVYVAAAILAGTPDHLIFTELVLQPTAGSYIKLQNPTAETMVLSDYYLTDATDTGAGKFYYLLPTANDYWSADVFDFILRFPDGYSIAAGADLVIGVYDSTTYQSEYASFPDLTIQESFRPAVAGSPSKPVMPFNVLDTANETLVLFKWDSIATVVLDIDYLIWGNTSHAIDKTGTGDYLDDTPVASQSFMPIHVDNEKLLRTTDEGSETTSGGNGISGHDETSEDLATTWQVVPLSSGKPEIIHSSVTPAIPMIDDNLTFQAIVTDDESGVSAELVHVFNTVTTVSPMTVTGGDTFQVILPAPGNAGSLQWKIRAEDAQGLKDSTDWRVLEIVNLPETVTIRDVLDNIDQYNGTIVELVGVITVPAGIIWDGRSQAYLQDNSERGIILDKSLPIDATLNRGDSVLVTAEVALYLETTPQLQNYTVQTIKTNATVPVVKLNLEEFATLQYNNAFVEVVGVINSRSVPTATNTGSNIVISDYTGEQTTVRIWNSTNILYNISGVLINNSLDSLLQEGTTIVVRGLGGEYQGTQLMPAFAEDISEWVEGEEGDFEIYLRVEPYPFVPQLGERINYEFSYPANSRIKLRLFDVAGRNITPLYDEFRKVSYFIQGSWNGRDELNRIVPPGVYLMHLEITDIKTGTLYTEIAPVVIGVYGK